MSSANPYAAPDSPSQGADPSRALVIGRGLLLTLTTTVAGAILGVLIGGGLGWLLPGYYRSVFPSGDSPHFDPVAVGLGMGLTQGAGLGMLVGPLLMAVYVWHRTRSANIAR